MEALVFLDPRLMHIQNQYETIIHHLILKDFLNVNLQFLRGMLLQNMMKGSPYNYKISLY